ncbi:MAG: hypothetical protein M5U27_01010 [Gaiella sp.]|nr:hypothetical protein [Gaiella sp.]
MAVLWFPVVLVVHPANLRPAAAHAARHCGVRALDERLEHERRPEGEPQR